MNMARPLPLFTNEFPFGDFDHHVSGNSLVSLFFVAPARQIRAINRVSGVSQTYFLCAVKHVVQQPIPNRYDSGEFETLGVDH